MKLFLKIIPTILLLVVCFKATAQRNPPNMADHDSKPYYFGITFGFNYSAFRISHTQSFVENDTFKSIQAAYRPGFNLGLMGNLRINNYIDLRFIPNLIFAEKALVMTDSANMKTDNSIESIYMDLPLQLKFKSDRINNFRFYGLIGGKFDYDLAANSRSRKQDEWLRVKPIDLGFEVGIGFEFYFPNFIFSPEIKLSQGLINSHYPDENIPLSNTLDKILTRMFVISIHLEG